MVETFTIPLAQLVTANERYLADTGKRYAGLCAFYATLPCSTAPPVTVRRDGRIVNGFKRTCAARLRGDTDVLCQRASLQQELSA